MSGYGGPGPKFPGAIAVGGATPAADGAGVSFPASQSASSDANTLDDYEEGTWTPSLGGNATYTAQTGEYTKIGRVVSIRATVTVNAIGTGSTSTITGAPFAAASVTGLSVGYNASLAAAPVSLGAYINVSSIVIIGRTAANATVTDALAVFGASARIDLYGAYFV